MNDATQSSAPSKKERNPARYAKLGAPAIARTLLRRALAVKEAEFGADHRELATTLLLGPPFLQMLTRRKSR